MEFELDPLGYAIWDCATNNSKENIIVQSDLCDDDLIPVPYLLRTLEEMPELEQFAIGQVSGKTLDIGAGSGCHAQELLSLGIEVLTIDTSLGAVDYCKSEGLSSRHVNILDITNEKYDTLLILMNGLGIAGTLEKMPFFLAHLKTLLTPKGKIICDSTDIQYMYEDEDGGHWTDLNAAYYGEMKFKMTYKKIQSDWFSWIYIDQKTLSEICSDIGLVCTIIFEAKNNHYLAELKIK